MSWICCAHLCAFQVYALHRSLSRPRTDTLCLCNIIPRQSTVPTNDLPLSPRRPDSSLALVRHPLARDALLPLSLARAKLFSRAAIASRVAAAYLHRSRCARRSGDDILPPLRSPRGLALDVPMCPGCALLWLGPSPSSCALALLRSDLVT